MQVVCPELQATSVRPDHVVFTADGAVTAVAMDATGRDDVSDSNELMSVLPNPVREDA